MPLRPSLPCSEHQIGLPKHGEVLHHPEARHVGEVLAELIQRLPIFAEKVIEKCASGGVGQRSEDLGSLLHDYRICDYLVTYQVLADRSSRRAEEWQDRRKPIREEIS